MSTVHTRTHINVTQFMNMSKNTTRTLTVSLRRNKPPGSIERTHLTIRQLRNLSNLNRGTYPTICQLRNKLNENTA